MSDRLLTPLPWFPARFHPNNLAAIRRNGDRFAGMEGPTCQLVYNCTIWEEPSPYEVDVEKHECLREIVAARTAFTMKYLAYGKAMRPVQFTAPTPQIAFSWQHYNSLGGRRENGQYVAPAVVHQAWCHWDGALGLLWASLDGASSIHLSVHLPPRKIILIECLPQPPST